MTTTCADCLRPCPEHGVTHCPTCHKHEGECGFGDCEADATHRVAQPGEVRQFCARHATAPEFGFARAGATVSRIEA